MVSKRIQSSNFLYGLGVSFAAWIGFAVSITDYSPSLKPHISQIIGESSQKEVAGVYANSIVAFVENALPLGNVCAIYCPTSAMRTGFFLMLSGPDNPISASIRRSSPFPAWSKMRHVLGNWSIFINPRPKSLLKCFRKGLLREEVANMFTHSSINGSGFVSRQPGPLLLKDENSGRK